MHAFRQSRLAAKHLIIRGFNSPAPGRKTPPLVQYSHLIRRPADRQRQIANFRLDTA
jgi:hypothetical protein